ncbi:MAG: undecaprenyldiphospho-muramoylpentapeptide beta-N-acetylglucosaminyltransferase [Desulfobacteraceae bacterium]|nr:undecaprenyldiphospho-muramoylpentapeptide beta-N-acetylglucosaminyltransferase [Desulfobacteraceae bacterium]MBC2719327.1 undecaprenyldiphospho-muramoylpentapeptide beta-N-acetylglucosaminyltransferase [Desulfobacteraceae bacterium]
MRLKHSAAENKMQKTNSNGKRIAIAGGGTGGHLFPGIAIAEAFIKRNPENRVIFISTGKPFEVSVLEEKSFSLKTITAEGIKGRGIVNQIISISKIPKGLFESMLILKDFRPHLIIGVGSYSAGPVVLGAWLMGVKIVLHEQNILPGITNRILTYLADRIYVSFKDTRGNFNPEKICFTGNPVRSEILCFAMKKSESSDFVQRKLFTIFVIGGSQGAHSINIAVLDALKFLKEKDSFFFIHQTGNADEEEVKNAYKKKGISSTVKSFFNDMGQQYKNADLIICRAGATTVAELTAIGKGALLIPYPFAADDHQVLNAKTLSDAGAAEIIFQKELSGRLLARKIKHYASNYNALSNMALMAKKLGKPDAADAIVDDCYRLMKRSRRPTVNRESEQL